MKSLTLTHHEAEGIKHFSFKKLLITTTIILFSLNIYAQDLPAGITGLGLQQLVNSTITNLTNAGTTLLGNGSVTIGGASSNLSALLNQFNSIVNNNISQPIANLSDNIKNLASQLYSISTRLNTILLQQQSCLLLNSQVVIASIQSVTSEIKNGIPIISKDASRLSYFQFDGHSPTIVPPTGGRVNIVGFKLWPGSMPPIVTILSEDRKNVLLQIKPDRSQNNNSLSFVLDSTSISKYAGQTLQVQVEPREKVAIFFTKSLGIFYLPIALPSSLSTELKIVAHAQYTCQKDTSSVLDYRAFRFDNSSCGDRANVTHTETWNLPPNGVILSVAYQGSIDQNNPNNISVNPIGNSITAAGWIDAPTCINLLFGQKLVKNTWWHASIAPVISYKTNVVSLVTGESEFIQMLPQATNILMNVNTPCTNPSSVVFWFDIVQKNGNNIQTIYTSARSTSPVFADDWKGLSINATLNTSAVNNTNQLAIKISQPQCGF